MTDVSIRTMLLEFVDSNGASHIREMHIEILRHKSDTPEHAIRRRMPPRSLGDVNGCRVRGGLSAWSCDRPLRARGCRQPTTYTGNMVCRVESIDVLVGYFLNLLAMQILTGQRQADGSSKGSEN